MKKADLLWLRLVRLGTGKRPCLGPLVEGTSPALPAFPGALTDLHAGLGEVGPHGQLLPRVHVGVVGLLEDLLQLLQLVAGEGGSVPPLLALVALRVGLLHWAGEVGAGPVLGPLHPSFLHTEVAAVHPHRVRVGWQLWLTQGALFG